MLRQKIEQLAWSALDSPNWMQSACTHACGLGRTGLAGYGLGMRVVVPSVRGAADVSGEGKPRNTLRGVGDSDAPPSAPVPRNTYDTREQTAVVIQAMWNDMTEEEKEAVRRGKRPPPTPLAGGHKNPPPEDPTPIEHPLKAVEYQEPHPPAALTDHKTIETKTIDLPEDERKAPTQRSLKPPPKPTDATVITRRRSSKMWILAAGVGVVFVVLFVMMQMRTGSEPTQGESVPPALTTSPTEVARATSAEARRASETVSPRTTASASLSVSATPKTAKPPKTATPSSAPVTSAAPWKPIF